MVLHAMCLQAAGDVAYKITVTTMTTTGLLHAFLGPAGVY